MKINKLNHIYADQSAGKKSTEKMTVRFVARDIKICHLTSDEGSLPSLVDLCSSFVGHMQGPHSLSVESTN